MSLPTYEQIMLPLLKTLSNGKEYNIQEMTNIISEIFKLTQEEKERLLPSGKERYIYNRTRWAKTYLYKAGLIDIVGRGTFKITKQGLEVIKKNPQSIDIKYLKKFDAFNKFLSKRNVAAISEESSKDTPEELIENYFESLKHNLINEIIDSIYKNSPTFFEELVVKVLLNLGYGASEKEARTTLKTNDEGIDGVIKEDKLGLDIIYVQAKRWKPDSSVGRPEIQKFAGALQGQRARKGIFITTSGFSKGAKEYARNIDSKIILIDGKLLAELMIDNNIGVSIRNSYHVKEIDTDYFLSE